MDRTQARKAAAQARKIGALTYTGQACKNCEGQERYTANGRCVPCAKNQAKRHYDKDAARERKRAYRARQTEHALNQQSLGAFLLADL